MASQEFLDQLGNSSSTSDEDGDEDASTSSEDMNGVGVGLGTSSIRPPKKVGNNKEASNAKDSAGVTATSTEPVKRRIKLTLRPSITPTDGGSMLPSVSDAASREASNGIKKEANNRNGVPPQVLAVKQEPNHRSSPPPAAPAPVTKPAVDKPVKASSPPQVAVKKERNDKPASGVVPAASKSAAAPPKKIKKKSAPAPKEGAVKAKKTEAKVKIKKEGGKVKKDGKVKVKVKKEAKVKSESETGSNGTALFASTLSVGPPKKKLKKKLPKLPLSMKRKLPLKGSLASESKAESSGSATAVVVDSNEPVEEDAVAVATVVESGSVPTAASNKTTAAPKAQPGEKKRQQAKLIRLPPMSSPGLLISHAAAGTYRAAVDSSGFAKPETVFEQSMAMAGYTTEGRTKEPHRGSSVKRVVGDMFDSDVAFTLNFPKLVPADLWDGPRVKDKGKSGMNSAGEPSRKTPPSILLMNSLKKCIKNEDDEAQLDTHVISGGKDSAARKRRRPWEFRDMLPVSLTLPYPASFIEKRLKYVGEVDKREKAIVAHQEAQEKIDIEQEDKELEQKPKIDNPISIPPIPSPPPPPSLSDFEGLDVDQYEDKHPIYVPKGKQNFVAHLDQDCFHITEGRYFGLLTNTIADPHFVGANAPGVAGLPVSVGSGLATSSTSSGTALKSESVLAVPPSAATTSTSKSSQVATASEKSPGKKEGTAAKPAKKTASLPAVKSGSKSKFKLKHVGPTPSATAADLRKLIDEGGETAEKTKQCIIRAAVHASRSGKHGQSFLAPDGKAYPDVSKAFAAHAGLKPCSRCKNNKQGAYHCRLRRKHKEPDHDGTNSAAQLAPLLLIPMEDLLIQPKSSAKTS